jgi:hypothetical protein
MKPIAPLRPLLWFDAATCAATGALLLAATGPMSEVLGLPPFLLTEAGILLMPFALFVAWSASRAEPSGSARLVIAANVAWVVGSLLLVAGPWLSPTSLGTAFVLVQAAAVAGIALLQIAATRRQALAA